SSPTNPSWVDFSGQASPRNAQTSHTLLFRCSRVAYGSDFLDRSRKGRSGRGFRVAANPWESRSLQEFVYSPSKTSSAPAWSNPARPASAGTDEGRAPVRHRSPLAARSRDRLASPRLPSTDTSLGSWHCDRIIESEVTSEIGGKEISDSVGR